MEKELFALLRLGLGLSTTEEENLSDFATMPPEKWAKIIETARRQGALGVVMDGIDHCQTCSTDYLETLPQPLRLRLIGEVLQIERRNQQQIEVMEEMAGKWTEKGLRVVVMKGQANATMYPKPEHRSPGDVDCYLFNDNDIKGGYREGNEVAREVGAKVDESWYKHSVISYKGETFENHQYFVHTRDGKRGKRLENELEEALAESAGNSDLFLPLTENTVMPPVQWTAMFLTYHACAHFVSEGLRLKQILDWAMFLEKHQGEVDWEAFWSFCERNHLQVFAEAVTAIARQYLGVCHTVLKENSDSFESAYAARILHNALYEEDYVFSSGKSRWANRIHLVRNLFHYRWKFEEIYEESIYKQLWYYATGFLFKTEG